MHRLSLTALLAATAAAAACGQEQPQPDNNAAEQPAVNLPSVPRPQPRLDRASILTAVAEAASASAAGAEVPESVRSLDGRQFELRIRFGCRGPAITLSDRWLGWSFDAEGRRIRVRAMPTISKDEAIVEQLGGGDFEAVEGFWIPRPWLLQPVCPASAAVRPASSQEQAQTTQDEQQQAALHPTAQESESDQRGEPVPAPPRIGIAQFFTERDPRTRRRGSRPYEAAHKLPEGQAISSQGYNLVLSGRLRALPGRGIIQCTARGPDSPPECIISAEFLRVWIEQPGTRNVIAQWGGG